MSGKRFLFLITHYDPVIYGAENFAKHLAEYLVQQGNQVDLITGRWESSWSELENINGVNVYRIPVIKIRYLQTLLFVGPQLWKARQLLRQNRYDYIHAHIFPSLLTVAILSKLNPVPVTITTIQGGDLADYSEIYGPAAPLFRPLIAWSLSQVYRLHTVSRDLAHQVRELTGRSSIIIPNGVDAVFLKSGSVKLPTKLFNKLPSTKHWLYSPSRLTDKNNLTETIRAIKLCRDQGLDVGLVIGGTGHLESSLQTLIKDLHLKSQVVLLGHVPHHHSMSLIKKADALVRVSLQEGFGISILEAMAVGTPVITSQSGGLSDFVSNTNSYIPSDHNAPAIAEVIQTCLADKQSSDKTTTARQLVADKYTWDKILPRFIGDLYGQYVK